MPSINFASIIEESNKYDKKLLLYTISCALEVVMEMAEHASSFEEFAKNMREAYETLMEKVEKM